MTGPDQGLFAALLDRGISRRSFLGFSAAMAAALALPATFAPRIAAAVAAAPRIPVVWLRGQDCGGDTEALLRAAHPTVSELVLDLLSVEYHESLMAGAGTSSGTAITSAMERYPGGYIAVVEGAVPTVDGGACCTLGGRALGDIVREVCDGALGTIAVGSCAADGGVSAAVGGPTGAGGVRRLVSRGPFVSLPGCPVNVENLTATIVHYLTFRLFPATDSRGRPLFAYGGLIHNQCERRAHFEFGEFVLEWGDEGAQKGWCLYKMGCKGPETYANCPTVRYGEGTSWPVKAGHGCIGCTMPGSWDAMSPFYRRLPPPLPFAPQVTADQVGQALVGGVAAMTVAHGGASFVRQKRAARAERHHRQADGADASAEAPTAAERGVGLPAGLEADPNPALEAGEPEARAPEARAPEAPEPDAQAPEAPEPDRDHATVADPTPGGAEGISSLVDPTPSRAEPCAPPEVD